jgi:hypothetical protein
MSAMNVVTQVGLGLFVIVGGLIAGLVVRTLRPGTGRGVGELTLFLWSLMALLLVSILALSGQPMLMLVSFLFIAWYFALTMDTWDGVKARVRRVIRGT